MTTKLSRKELRKKSVYETLSNIDRLPDSSYVRVQVIAAHLDISMATFWRRLKSGSLPALRDGRMNVGEYRRAIGTHAIAA